MSEMSLRHNDGKLPLNVVHPDMIEQLAGVLAWACGEHEGPNGMKPTPYPRDNWMKGSTASRNMNSLMRHLEAYRRGETFDLGSEGSGYHHLSHVAVCALMHVVTEMHGLVEDDRATFPGADPFEGEEI